MLISRGGVDGFRAGFVVLCIAAALGAVTAGTAFPNRGRSLVDEAALDTGPEADGAFVPAPLPVADGGR
jgi:hypothetical protein